MPRCRTIIVPALTFSPAKRLTPSRCELAYASFPQLQLTVRVAPIPRDSSPGAPPSGAPKTPHYIVEDKCIACGTCVEACKFNAIVTS